MKTEAEQQQNIFSAAISKKILFKSKISTTYPKTIKLKEVFTSEAMSVNSTSFRFGKVSFLLLLNVVSRLCRACGRQGQHIRGRTRITPELMVAYSYACMRVGRNLNVQADDEVYMCRICKMHMTAEFNRLEGLHHDEEGLVSMTFRIPVQEEGRCFICQHQDPDNEVDVMLQVNIYIAANLYVDTHKKICRRHVNQAKNKILNTPELEQVQWEEQIVRMGGHQAKFWLNETRNAAMRYKNKEVSITEHFRGIPGEDFRSLFGITKDQFDEVLRIVQDYRSPKRSRCNDKNLMLLLLKIRHGQSLSYLKALFGYRSKGAVSSAMKVARLAMKYRFVPRFLGARNHTREQILPHVTQLARTLHLDPSQPDSIVITIDGTYLYLPKSFNFAEMRKTYCTYKHRNLLKMTMCVMPDGYMLDAHGPYYSDPANTDARTLRHDLEQNVSGLKDLLRPGDVIVYDRGYPDMLDVLEPLGVQGIMPHYLARGQRQHTTQEANESRIVTVTRWIIEQRNGHIKSFSKLLARTITAGDAPYVGDYFRIVCALINAFRPTVHSRSDTEEIGRILLRRKEQNNELCDYIQGNNLVTRRGQWQAMEDVQLEDFPRLTHDQLFSLTLGEYQIRQAASYAEDMEDREGEWVFQIARADPSLLRGRVFSRHRAAATYHQFIRFTENLNSPEAIRQWYCTCIVGARVVGMCSHICTILWYLCIDRYNPDLRRPRRRLQGVVYDAANREEEEEAAQQ